MEIGPRRGRLLFGFILFLAMFALAVVMTIVELREGRVNVLIALGVVLFPLLMAGYGTMLFRSPATLLTLSPEGIRFHLPAFGLVPWRDIGAAGIVPTGLFRMRVLAIDIKPAVPRSNLLIVNLVGIGKKRIEGRDRIFYALRMLDRSPDEIEAELARLRPARPA